MRSDDERPESNSDVSSILQTALECTESAVEDEAKAHPAHIENRRDGLQNVCDEERAEVWCDVRFMKCFCAFCECKIVYCGAYDRQDRYHAGYDQELGLCQLASGYYSCLCTHHDTS